MTHKGVIAGKPILLVASAGGSGRGSLTALEQMERFCDHTGARIFDRISVNRWNSDYKREAAHAAAKALAGGRRPGETVMHQRCKDDVDRPAFASRGGGTHASPIGCSVTGISRFQVRPRWPASDYEGPGS